jgi:hypothetical protein
MEITDPALISKLAAQFAEQPASEAAPVQTIPPTDNLVRLPGGYIKDRKVIKHVEVRELTGEDEEALAATSSTGAAVAAILNRGLKSIDGSKPRPEDFDSLLLGDIETIVLGVYIATFGAEVTYSYSCHSCGHSAKGEIDLASDVKYVELLDASDTFFKVDLRGNRSAMVNLPNGVTQRRLLELDSATDAELTTAILAGCLVSVDGQPSSGVSTAKQLSMADRSEIIKEVLDRNPGPRLGEVSKACEACGTNHIVPLSLAALFRV